MRNSLYSEEHEMVRQAVRRFAEKELLPHAAQWEAAEYFADWVFPRMGTLGFLGLRYPQRYGGQGGDYAMGLVFAEEMAHCGLSSVAMAAAVHAEMATPPLLKFGSEDQKQRFLVPAIRGEKVACLGITEPNAGSDVASIATRAVRDGNSWILNGQKIFITNGVRADFIVLLAKTAPTLGRKGLSLFLVEKGTPGFRVTNTIKKVGMRASDTAELVFDDCRIPETNLLGEENKGFYQIMWELQGERMVGAIMAVAEADRVFHQALAYAQQRVQFGQPIGKFQAIAHKLASMATAIEAARQLNYSTAQRLAEGENLIKEVAMCKLVSARVACQVADTALQIHGGYGFTMDFPVQQAWRDLRLSRIGGGTDEVMKDIIAKSLGL